jgi:hypothetical protein
MKYKELTLSVALVCLLGVSVRTTHAQEKGTGQINWMEGYIHAVGEGTATPAGDKIRERVRAIRAATIMAQRSLLEMVKDLRIDSETKVKNRMVEEDVINSRVEGAIRGAEIIKQNVRWEGDVPVATVELRICLSGVGACKPETSIIPALALDQKNEPSHVPRQRLNDMVVEQEHLIPKVQHILYDVSRPVTGIIFSLQGLTFERVILPVVIAFGDGNRPFTVYSVKSVDPQVIRTFGVTRYADSVEQAKKNPHLGENAMVVPVSGVTKENMIIIGFDAARMIRETTSHGNDYLRQAKVIIAAQE